MRPARGGHLIEAVGRRLGDIVARPGPRAGPVVVGQLCHIADRIVVVRFRVGAGLVGVVGVAAGRSPLGKATLNEPRRTLATPGDFGPATLIRPESDREVGVRVD